MAAGCGKISQKWWRLCGTPLADTAPTVKYETPSPLPPLTTFPPKAPSCQSIQSAQSMQSSQSAPACLGSKAVNDRRDPYLYIILPYFNYCCFKRRKQLFVEFIQRIRREPRVRIVISEAILITESAAHQAAQALPPQSGIWRHLRYTTDDPIWLKENLINLAIAQLPETWNYAAWIDADLTFLSKTWVADTIAALNRHDVVQMFFRCDNLDQQGKPFKHDKGFAYQYRESGRAYTKTYKYGFWHPGFAWALTRHAYNTMDGLIDWGILGSGDHHMALALIGKVECSHPGNIHKTYAILLNSFQDRVRELSLGYVPGVIQHHWHGSIADRRYQERWGILTKNAYDPKTDIVKNRVGLNQLTGVGAARLRQPIKEYFVGRREDS